MFSDGCIYSYISKRNLWWESVVIIESFLEESWEICRGQLDAEGGDEGRLGTEVRMMEMWIGSAKKEKTIIDSIWEDCRSCLRDHVLGGKKCGAPYVVNGEMWKALETVDAADSLRKKEEGDPELSLLGGIVPILLWTEGKNKVEKMCIHL